MKKRSIMGILGIVLLLVVVTIIICGNTVGIYLAPGLILSEALEETYDKVSKLLEQEPARILMEVLDDQGHQTVYLDLSASNPSAKSASCDMTLCFQPHRLLADGQITLSDRKLDLTAYADTKGIAISSGTLLDGQFYGITYDTFMTDIQKIPLLGWIVSDALAEQWAQSLNQVKIRMENLKRIPAISRISQNEWKQLTLAVKAIPARVQKTRITVGKQALDCHRLSYQLDDARVIPYLKTFLPIESTKNAQVRAACYLREKQLLLADIQIDAGDQRYHIQLEPGQSQTGDPLNLLWQYEKDQENLSVQLTISDNEDLRRERWIICQNGMDEGNLELSYIWEPATGILHLNTPAGDQIPITMQQASDRLILKTDEFSKILDAIHMDRPDFLLGLDRCTLVLEKGAMIDPPDYRNLDTWSLEDFLTLLEGIGSLLGIGI